MTLEAWAIISADEALALCWYLPSDRTSASLPDEHGDMWYLLVKHKPEMAGDAHSHPGTGIPGPSWDDITSYAGCEKGLRKRYKHWIASMDRMVLVTWRGPGRYDYETTVIDKDSEPGWVEELRRKSRSLDPFPYNHDGSG